MRHARSWPSPPSSFSSRRAGMGGIVSGDAAPRSWYSNSSSKNLLLLLRRQLPLKQQRHKYSWWICDLHKSSNNQSNAAAGNFVCTGAMGNGRRKGGTWRLQDLWDLKQVAEHDCHCR